MIESATLRSAAGKLELAPKLDGDILGLEAGSPIAAGRYVLELEFKNRYNTRADSLYKVVVNGEPYLFTQFEDTSAREAFPCWDEPSYKIPWKLTLAVPADPLALANAPIASESTADGFRTGGFK